jgi:transposase
MGTQRNESSRRSGEAVALSAELRERETQIATLILQLTTKDREIAALRDDVTKLHGDITKLEHNVAVLTKMVFGPRSEKSPVESAAANGRQGHLFLEEIAAAAKALAEEKQVVATVELKSEGSPTAPRRGRRQAPEKHLPRVTTTIELPPEQRICCGQTMEPMGKEVTKVLERVETFVAHEIERVKYCCRVCQDHVKIAPAPDRVIDKGILGTGAIAHVMTERFANHLPYHRLEKKYEAEGVKLSRTVLCRTVLQGAEILEPVFDEHARETLASSILHSDDTPVFLQESSTGGAKTARLWIYLDQEGRHVYDFTESRSRDGPQRILADFKGYLQVDAFGGYDVFFGPGSKMTEVGCWAHARRYFKRALDSEKDLAMEAMARIRQLYLIEREAKLAGLEPDGVRRLRQEQALPLLASFKAWLELTRTQVLDKGPMAKAIHYATSNWTALTRYTEDGRLAIDNNAAERALRVVAVGRKNWIQIGNERGGKAAATLYSLVMTCKAIGIDPKTYLADVLLRIGKESDVKKLTPRGWKKHFAHVVAAKSSPVLAAAVAAR